MATALAALRGFIDIDDKPLEAGLERSERQANAEARLVDALVAAATRAAEAFTKRNLRTKPWAELVSEWHPRQEESRCGGGR